MMYIHFSIAHNDKLLVLCIFSMDVECALFPYFILSFAILLDADLELLEGGIAM